MELPSGEAVLEIAYSLREPSLSAEEFFAKVESKYWARPKPTASTIEGDQDFKVDGFKMTEEIRLGQKSSFLVKGRLEPQARRRAIEAARPKTQVETTF